MVLGTMFILTAFLLASLALAMNNMVPARADQDSKAALAAAQAGIDEYISQLSASGGQYWTNGGVDANNPAFDTVPATRPATVVVGACQAAAVRAARFCYKVLTPKTVTAAEGYIDLMVTGSSTPPGGGAAVTRTLTTTLRPKGFIDFVYFTDVEVVDPVLLGHPAGCADYHYDGRSTSQCANIRWADKDEVDGPLHSNDALLVEGDVRFLNPRTESSWPKDKGGEPDHLWWTEHDKGPKQDPGFLPVYAAKLPLPVGNQELLKYVMPKLDSSTNLNRPGCLYTGATRIQFVGTSMKVLSPNTTNAPVNCLNVLNRANEQTLAIPPVIYVKPASGACTGVGYPRSHELTDAKYVTATNYEACRGTAFVEGTVDGQVTVSAEDDVLVTADLVVQDRNGTDIVGLVAGNYVWIYHPIDDKPIDEKKHEPPCIEPNCPKKSDFENLLDEAHTVDEIDAAMLSLRHSILVQNWDMGDHLKELTIFGALAQKFRGPVGTSAGTGYDKDYIYDERLRLLQPPFFLAPESAP